MGLERVLVVLFSIILFSSTIFASFPYVQSNNLSDDNQRLDLSEIIPSFPKAFGSEPPFIGSFTVRNDKPGPVTLEVLGKDARDSTTIDTTLVWDKSDNTFSIEFLEIPRTTTTLRLTFAGDGNAFIDFFTINGDVYEAEDFDRTGGCGTPVVDGRTVADCDNVNDFVEFDLNKGKRFIETIELDDIQLKPGQILVLADITDFDLIETVHVAANLPCKTTDGPNEGPGNDTPDVKIIAGNAATGIFGDVIESAADDTGLAGPEVTCVFHDTFFPTMAVPEITDIVLINVGIDDEDIDLKEVVVTITISANTDRSLTTEALRDLEKLKTELVEVKEDVKSIRGTVKTAFEFELDSSSTELGAVSFTIFGRCLLAESEGPCSFFELKKIVAPPLSNSVFLVLCVDNFTCSILQDRGYKIGFSVEGGFSLAAHGAGGSGANVDGPIIPIIPTNILKVSGLGPTSAKSIITIADVSLVPPQLGLKGKMKFVGERPLDMEILGWFLDPVDGFKCFDKDGSITCPPETTPSKTCFEVNLLPSIDLSEVKSILSAKSIKDIKIPLKTKDFTICTDGTFTPPDLTGFEIFNNPVGSLATTAGDFCKITAGGLVCKGLKLDTSAAAPIIDANTIDAIDKTIKNVEGFVDDIPAIQSTVNVIEAFVDNLPAIQSTVNAIDDLVTTIGLHIQQILDDLDSLEIGGIDLGGSGGSGGNSGGCFLENPLPPPTCLIP